MKKRLSVGFGWVHYVNEYHVGARVLDCVRFAREMA